MADGSIALAFFNLSGQARKEKLSISMDTVLSCIGAKLPDAEKFRSAAKYAVTDLWSGEESATDGKELSVEGLEAHGNRTFRIRPVAG